MSDKKAMHEFVLADRVLQSVLEYMNDHDLTSVRVVNVDVGELLGLGNESLRTAFSLLSKNTAADGAKIRIRRIKGSVICNKCDYAGGLEHEPTDHAIDPVFACPHCGTPLSIKEGNELKITKVL